MKKLFGFMAAVVASLTISAPAHASLLIDIQSLQQNAQIQAAVVGLPWTVGDRASYKISGGIINGTIDAFIREDTGTGFWMQQDANMGIFGKQKVEILFNKADGQILKMLVNGQEQEIPEAGDVEVIEMTESRVRVPAGEFDCIYIKAKDNKSGQMQEAWVNPQEIPLSGMLKSMSDTQFGKISQELTSFQFANK